MCVWAGRGEAGDRFNITTLTMRIFAYGEAGVG